LAVPNQTSSFAGGYWLICPDDETAKEYARQLADGHDVELWQGDHQIATFDRKPE
jgi:hypothetical protein